MASDTVPKYQTSLVQSFVLSNMRERHSTMSRCTITLTGKSVTTMRGAKRLKMPVRLDYIRVTTYSGTKSTGVVSMVSDIMTDVRDKPILLLDDGVFQVKSTGGESLRIAS